MYKIFIYSIIILPAILIGVGVTLYFFQEKMVFAPDKLSQKYKFRFEQEFVELYYKTEDGNEINALHFKAENSRGVVFYQHGNAGSLAGWGERAIDFIAEDYDVLMYDYRGFGKSTGSIKNEKMLYNDALMIYKKMMYDYKERDIIVYGMSLGTGIAAKLAHENNPKLLVLETPYFNFYDVAKFHYPYLPNSILLHYQFKTNKLLPDLKIPIYLFHGTEDETVPYESSQRLLALSENITLFTVKDGSHNNLNTFHDYHDGLKRILR